MKILRDTHAPRAAVAAQNFGLGGNTLVCIGKRLGENGNGLVPEVLETHAHVSNVSPRVANCAELPVENCKRAAEIGEPSDYEVGE